MRYEIKYRIELFGLASIEAVILMQPASFSTSFPDRQVNNIYLDTPNLHCFYQNIEGVHRRQKMRLRWYGKMDYPQNNSVLEIKNKNAELGWKDSFKVYNRSIDTKEELLSAIAVQPVRLGTLTPILHNSYYRKYYISSDGLFRLTIDSEQSFKLPFSNMDALDLSSYPIIVELKYEAEYAEQARDIMDYLPFRQTKNSKYTNGVTELLF